MGKNKSPGKFEDKTVSEWDIQKLKMERGAIGWLFGTKETALTNLFGLLALCLFIATLYFIAIGDRDTMVHLIAPSIVTALGFLLGFFSGRNKA